MSEYYEYVNGSSSRDLKSLSQITTTPIFTQFNETLMGLYTFNNKKKGKSSLIKVIFRIIEPKNESIILIDNINCLNLGLKDLRSNLSIIPQDPVVFSGTNRFNLDPFNEYSDSKIWDILKKIELFTFISNKKNKLESIVLENANNFSQGQKQLMCISRLSRALLNESKILPLDEATSSIENKNNENENDKISNDEINSEHSGHSISNDNKSENELILKELGLKYQNDNEYLNNENINNIFHNVYCIYQQEDIQLLLNVDIYFVGIVSLIGVTQNHNVHYVKVILYIKNSLDWQILDDLFGVVWVYRNIFMVLHMNG